MANQDNAELARLTEAANQMLKDGRGDVSAISTWPEHVWFKAGDFDEIEDFYKYFTDEEMSDGYTSEPTDCVSVGYIRADVVYEIIKDALAKFAGLSPDQMIENYLNEQ